MAHFTAGPTNLRLNLRQHQRTEVSQGNKMGQQRTHPRTEIHMQLAHCHRKTTMVMKKTLPTRKTTMRITKSVQILEYQLYTRTGHHDKELITALTKIHKVCTQQVQVARTARATNTRRQSLPRILRRPLQRRQIVPL